MTDETRITAEMPCYNRCIVKGTEKDDQPQLRAAKHGNFCAREYRSAKSALDLAPAVVEHVLSLVESHGAAGDRVDSSREAPLPMNEQAFNDANNIYQRLVYWARHFAHIMDVQAPGPAVRAWRDMSGNIVGLPVGITPSGARYVVGIMATWLTIHLEQICDLPAVDDVDYFLTGAGQIRELFTINARWPQEARAEYSQMPCPVCKAKLGIYPPVAAHEDQLIKCDHGHVLTRDQYEDFWTAYKDLQAETDPVKRHLMRKWGGTETTIKRFVDGVEIEPRHAAS